MWCDAMMWLGAYWWFGQSSIHYMLVLGAPHCHLHFACLYTLLLTSQHFQCRYGWQQSVRSKRNFMISSFHCLWEVQKLKSGTQVDGIRCNFLYKMYIYISLIQSSLVTFVGALMSNHAASSHAIHAIKPMLICHHSMHTNMHHAMLLVYIPLKPTSRDHTRSCIIALHWTMISNAMSNVCAVLQW
jgi:hypothetical protein